MLRWKIYTFVRYVCKTVSISAFLVHYFAWNVGVAKEPNTARLGPIKWTCLLPRDRPSWSTTCLFGGQKSKEQKRWITTNKGWNLFSLGGSFLMARQTGCCYILVFRQENLIIPGHQASDFASPASLRPSSTLSSDGQRERNKDKVVERQWG